MKVKVTIHPETGIRIEPGPEEVARQEAMRQARQLLAKATLANADIKQALQSILDRLDAIERRLG
ncbi:hypothetical protein HRbin24_00543 [bacterium HR24]|nr:hypothetical protein HRbin24_00543 [bacterium HR24]